MTQRYCLAQDECCDWYLIPVEQLQEFHTWREAVEAFWADPKVYGDYSNEEPKLPFGILNIEHPFRLTFTDPKLPYTD